MIHWDASPQFRAALDSYVAGCKRIYAEYCAKNDFANQDNEGSWEAQWLQKRVRLVHVNYGAHSFVDIATGDVLKPASWKAPAKHSRGNIFDAQNGLGSMGPHGPAYLR